MPNDDINNLNDCINSIDEEIHRLKAQGKHAVAIGNLIIAKNNFLAERDNLERSQGCNTQPSEEDKERQKQNAVRNYSYSTIRSNYPDLI